MTQQEFDRLVALDIQRLVASAHANRPLTVGELEAKWNAQADNMNQWSELGIDEIVWYAQTHKEMEKAK